MNIVLVGIIGIFVIISFILIDKIEARNQAINEMLMHLELEGNRITSISIANSTNKQYVSYGDILQEIDYLRDKFLYLLGKGGIK